MTQAKGAAGASLRRRCHAGTGPCHTSESLQDRRALTPGAGSSVARIMDEREKRVLGFMVAGLHSAEIAAELGINGSMAKALMNSVLVELGAYGNPRPLPPGQRPVRFSDDWHLIRLQKLLRQRW